jgi:hypothetical protein
MTGRPARIARLPLSVALRWSVALSMLLTVLLVAVLSVRMAAGADPALGPKIVRQQSTTQAQSSAASAQPTQTAAVAPQTVAPVVTAPPAAPQVLAPVQTSSS